MAKVTPLMNVELTREFTGVKVKQALKQMKTMTALGPDGRLSHGERERERILKCFFIIKFYFE